MVICKNYTPKGCYNFNRKNISRLEKHKIYRMALCQLAIPYMLFVQILNDPIPESDSFDKLSSATNYLSVQCHLGPITSSKYCATKVSFGGVALQNSYEKCNMQAQRSPKFFVGGVPLNNSYQIRNKCSFPILCMRCHTPRVPPSVSYFRFSSRSLPGTGHQQWQ